MTTWDPDQYARYRGYRTRPADDLMARIPADLRPREVWDLGCGPGEQALELAARYPDARVRGLDSSAPMLARARETPSRVEWVAGDIGRLRTGDAAGPDLDQRRPAVAARPPGPLPAPSRHLGARRRVRLSGSRHLRRAMARADAGHRGRGALERQAIRRPLGAAGRVGGGISPLAGAAGGDRHMDHTLPACAERR